MPKITQSDIINSFQQLRENYSCFVNISKLIEMMLSLTPPGLINKQIFSYLLNVLGLMRSYVPDDSDALHLITRIRLLA